MNTSNMSNDDKDKFIKDSLSEDTYVFSGNDAYDAIISTEIDEAKIKPQRYTYKQKKIVLVLLILLCISLILNAYFLSGNGIKLGAKTYKEITVSPIVIEDNITDKTQDEEAQNVVQEQANVAFSQVEKDSLVLNTVVPQKTEEEKEKNEADAKEYSSQINEDDLKQVIKMYALGLGRFDDIIDTKEENTILLVITANGMQNQRISNKDSKKASNYATTRENVDKFIEELTGKKPANILESYNNYIGYSQASNAYIWGKDGNPFANEKYEVLTLEFSEKNNSGFKVSGLIEKTLDGQRYVYHYNATISSNGSDYTYNPYQVKTFTYNLTEGEYLVFRLFDKVEEVDPKLKKSN